MTLGQMESIKRKEELSLYTLLGMKNGQLDTKIRI